MTAVLIAEDDEALRNLLVLILQREGLDVRAVANGARAIDAIRAETPDLVVLDLHMPELDGQQVCEQVRGCSLTAELPILMLSGSLDHRDPARRDEAGADAFLQKPFTTDELVRAVQRLVDGHVGGQLGGTTDPFVSP